MNVRVTGVSGSAGVSPAVVKVRVTGERGIARGYGRGVGRFES